MMTLNAKLRSSDGSERQTENSDDSSERQNWEAMMIVLNAETENDDGSDRQTEKW